jgi:hypothetical protein
MAAVGNTIQFVLGEPDEAVALAASRRPALKADVPVLTCKLSAEEMLRLAWSRYDVAEGMRTSRCA